MTRGNQRDQDREKALKKLSAQKKGREVPEGVSFKTVKEKYVKIS
jgi:hypothetical protein